MISSTAAWPSGISEAAEQLRRTGWDPTPLGPLAAWPQWLRQAVDQVLATPVAAILLCGPQLLQIYNDPWIALHPGKHPHAFGLPTAASFPERIAILEPVYRRVVAGEGVALENCLLPSLVDGTPHDTWWNLSLTPLRGPSGTVDAIFCTVAETTTSLLADRAHTVAVAALARREEAAARLDHAGDESRAESVRQAGEEKFRTLFETMEQGFAECEIIRDAHGRAIDHRFLTINPAFARLAGVAVTAAHGRLASEVFPGLATTWIEHFDRIVKQGTPERIELEEPSLASWFAVSVYPQPGDRFVILYDNTTERKRAESRLRETEERFRLFVENVREYALMQTDLEGIVTSWNPGAERLFGYSSADIVGRPFVGMLPEEDRHEGFIAREMAKLGRGEKNIDAHAMQRKDGSRFWAEWVTEPVYDDLGSLRGTAKVMRDETDRQTAEAAVRASLADKEELLKEVHHRVKNNLQVITSLLNLQAGTVNDPNALALFEEARSRVQSIATIHELLYRSTSFASISLRTYALQLLPGLIDFYGMQQRVQASIVGDGETIELERAVPFGLLLNELVSNALKHAFPEQRTGIITIDIGRSGDDLILRVSDDGVGLPPGLDPLFSSSLGLKVVRVLIRQLRGSIRLTAGPGTTFEVQVPRCR